jgi:hypothetical protein
VTHFKIGSYHCRKQIRFRNTEEVPLLVRTIHWLSLYCCMYIFFLFKRRITVEDPNYFLIEI